MRGLTRNKIADLLDDQPVHRNMGPVRLGRSVSGWRDVAWGGDNQVNAGSIFNGSISVGRASRFGATSYVVGKVEIGRFCSFGAQVALLSALGHPLHSAALFTSPVLRRGPTGGGDEPERPTLRIGNDVWLGHGSTLVGGVTIGDGAVVGAGSVVTDDVEAFTIVAGTPARTIRPRFTPQIAELLAEWAWWELDPVQLVPFAELLDVDLTTDSGATVELLRSAIADRPQPARRPPEPLVSKRGLLSRR